MNTNKRNTIYIVLAVIFLVIILIVWRFRMSGPSGDQSAKTVSYACNGSKAIVARYYQGENKPASAQGEPPIPGGSADVVLSDGRTMALKQTISADGVRYANADESFVLWSKGNGALVLENNVEKSFIGCIEVAPEPTGSGLSNIYQNGALGFTMRLLAGYSVDESYVYQALGPGQEISGIKFTIPPALASGTNLSDDSYISVEEIPQTEDCSAQLFMYYGVPEHTVIFGNTTYSVASSTDAGAGNRYEETVYALPGTNPCVAVRYFVHYGVIENYPIGAVNPFDREALIGQFDRIRETLVLNLQTN